MVSAAYEDQYPLQNGLEEHLLPSHAEEEAIREKRPPLTFPTTLLCKHFLSSILVVAHLAVNVNYLAFKITLYTREFHEVIQAPWLLLVLACECIYFLSTLIFAVDNLVPPSVRHEPSVLQDYPTVDILLPCCKEPTDVPQDSIMAALAMDYPRDRFRVLILDDGADDDLRAFCHTLQVESGDQYVMYLRRPKIQGVPHNFKCGNMNYGLEHSNAEYVVMMDADMILHPTFLRRLLPYIVNSPDVAFVQVPQAFYNLPPGDPLNDSTVFFYDRTLVHRDTLSCATCVGTGAIFRRKHLDDIGGFQPQSITEDTMTAFTLFNQGYKSVYLNEKLQIGLTPWTFVGYINQRERWGQGAIQQFRSTWKSMLGKKSKLSFLLKVCYFWHTGYYYMSIFNALLVLVLLNALAFRLKLTIGDHDDSHRLIAYLALVIVVWRIAWYSLWFGIPQSIQSRNRDESHFWWMTPFFFKMVMKAFFSYGQTFKFVPTSNIDRTTAARDGANQPTFLKRLIHLKEVRIHIAYITTILVVVGTRVFLYITRYGIGDCKEMFYVVALSFFLLTTCAHMLLPVIYILWPTNCEPTQRKLLIEYDAKGVPTFTKTKCTPKWHWLTIFYEIGSYATLIFWSGVLWIAISRRDKDWCKQGMIF